MTTDEKRQKALNSVQLMLNTVALGSAASVALSDPRILPLIQDVEVQLPRHRIPLLQIAEALCDPAARTQLTEELQKLVFRSCVADAFEAAERYVSRAHAGHLDDIAWYWYGKAIRNALRHSFRISLRGKAFRSRVPLRWREKELSSADEGKPIEEVFDHSDGLQLMFDMKVTLSPSG